MSTDYSTVGIPACLGVEPLATLTLCTPVAHARFELAPLPEADTRAVPEGMPWEQSSEQFNAFTKSIGIPVTAAALFGVAVKRTKVECEKEALYAQRSLEWLKAREFTVSASQFGAAAAHSKYCSPAKLLREKIHPRRHFATQPVAERLMQWGTDHEPHAEEAFLECFVKPRLSSLFTLSHPRVCKHSDAPWLAFSPDGILSRRVDEQDVVELVEYKSPAHARHAPQHPYAKFPYNVPPQYMDQMQGSMWLMRNVGVFPHAEKVERAWFVCWQPHALRVTMVPYMPVYAEKLIASLKAFYFGKFLPGCVEAINERRSLEPLV